MKSSAGTNYNTRNLVIKAAKNSWNIFLKRKGLGIGKRSNEHPDIYGNQGRE